MALFLSIFLATVFGLLGGWIYRVRGGGRGPKYPRPIYQMLYSLPVLSVALVGVPWFLAIAGYVWMVAWTLSGHGGFMDLGTWLNKRAQERLEPLIRWLYNKMPEYWYDVLGLALTGVVPVALSAAVTVYWSLPVALAILATGFLKAVMYMVGRAVRWDEWASERYFNADDLDEPTERGEYGFGFATWFVIILAILLFA